MPEVKLDAGAQRALKKLWRTDMEAARRIQEVVDEIESGGLPLGSERLTNADQVRRVLGVLPYKVARGKLRVIFTPGERIIALGYRKNVYGILGNGWSN